MSVTNQKDNTDNNLFEHSDKGSTDNGVKGLNNRNTSNITPRGYRQSNGTRNSVGNSEGPGDMQ